MNPYVSNDLFYIDSAKHLLSSDLVLRQRQVSRLAAGRASVRHIVAPAGFGKSSLAFLYGKLAFGPKHFWWVDASDPRFALGLDDKPGFEDPLGHIVDLRKPSLLVFDSVPLLSAERKSSFARLIIRAQSRGWEVLVCSRPIAGLDLEEAFSTLRRDPSVAGAASAAKVLTLRSADLMLSDDELDGLDFDGDSALLPSGDIARVPVCAFGRQAGRAEFLERISADLDDPGECLCVLSMVSRPRSVDDLVSLSGGSVRLDRSSFELDWPCAGVSSNSDECHAALLSEDERLRLFERSQAALERAFDGCESDVPNEAPSVPLRRRLCSCLVKRGDESLAGRITALSGNSSEVLDFVSRRGLSLLASCKPLALSELLTSMDESRLGRERRSQLALALSLLGDAPAALSLVEKAPSKVASSSFGGRGSLGLLSMLVLILDGRIAPSRQGVRAAVESAAAGSLEPPRRKEGVFRACSRASELALMGEARLATCLESLFSEPSSIYRGGLLGEISLALLLRRAMGLRPRTAGRLSQAFVDLVQFVSDAPGEAWVDLVLFDLVASWVGRESLGDIDLFERAQATREDLESQRRSWRKRAHVALMKERGSFVSSKTIVPSFSHVRVIPKSLEERAAAGSLRVFGGFDLSLPVSGDDGSSSGRFESVRLRAKGRLLVGLLAANHGCEVSREWLGGQLWPLVDSHSQRVSFYSLWSYVSRVVRPYEVAPFLESTRSSAAFKDGVIRLDVQEVDAACSRLEQGGMSSEECVRLVSQIKNAYRGPFMPGVEHAEIESIRMAWEKRVIDALLRTQPCLEGSGELSALEEALDFAFRIDPSRQDVCHALMLAQRSLGRHADATSSFIECRRASADNHGIGVAPQLNDLYQEVLAEVS